MEITIEIGEFFGIYLSMYSCALFMMMNLWEYWWKTWKVLWDFSFFPWRISIFRFGCYKAVCLRELFQEDFLKHVPRAVIYWLDTDSTRHGSYGNSDLTIFSEALTNFSIGKGLLYFGVSFFKVLRLSSLWTAFKLCRSESKQKKSNRWQHLSSSPPRHPQSITCPNPL